MASHAKTDRSTIVKKPIFPPPRCYPQGFYLLPWLVHKTSHNLGSKKPKISPILSQAPYVAGHANGRRANSNLKIKKITERYNLTLNPSEKNAVLPDINTPATFYRNFTKKTRNFNQKMRSCTKGSHLRSPRWRHSCCWDTPFAPGTIGFWDKGNSSGESGSESLMGMKMDSSIGFLDVSGFLR